MLKLTKAPCVEIYVAGHCANSHYAIEVAQLIRSTFPEVELRVIDLENSNEPIPESVFATPTYLLNGRLWSLGNPSPAQIRQALAREPA